MVRLRLMRMGKKKQPTYRIVAADSRSPRNGRFIEIVGTYEPRREPSVIDVDNEKALKWLRNGAKPSERVEKLLRISGAWDDFKGLPAGTSIGTPPEPGRRPKSKAEEAAEPEAVAAKEPEAEAAPEPVSASVEESPDEGDAASQTDEPAESPAAGAES